MRYLKGTLAERMKEILLSLSNNTMFGALNIVILLFGRKFPIKILWILKSYFGQKKSPNYLINKLVVNGAFYSISPGDQVYTNLSSFLY